ncbi:hypothetical protein I8751_02460 [Nostocaceae cyanobacterium CENA357]|uniref:Uncharacterized protein n=1 Tax=Atlanticothrix silvestris CENA357 TaxID=1725252 RepID=A0A8J7H6I5_9CYAN|nr:hypothetical protein [Atlanticothrix silvestris]MBH8551262.1 hypothetical protein [Atlanticothrix silvestris CENA357]
MQALIELVRDIRISEQTLVLTDYVGKLYFLFPDGNKVKKPSDGFRQVAVLRGENPQCFVSSMHLSTPTGVSEVLYQGKISYNGQVKPALLLLCALTTNFILQQIDFYSYSCALRAAY